MSMGPEKTIDGSGLNAADEHSTSRDGHVAQRQGRAQPTWIQYAFDKAYKLDKMLVWNSNQVMESILGFGAKNVTVEYSTDGATWTALGEFEFAQAPGLAPTRPIRPSISAARSAKHVKLTIKSNWGGLLPQYRPERSPLPLGSGLGPRAESGLRRDRRRPADCP